MKPAQSPNQGISINVNIQNMLQPQRIATISTTEQPTQIAKSERSHFG